MSLLVKQWKGEATLLSFIKTFCYNLNSKRDFEVKYIMISSNKYDVDYKKGIIKNISHRTLVKDFLLQLDAKGSLIVYDVDNNFITDTTRYIRSGMIVKEMVAGDVHAEYKVLVNQPAEHILPKDSLDIIPTNAETEMIAGVDQYSGNRIVVYKQGSMDWNDASAVVWEWTPTKSLGYVGFDCKGNLNEQRRKIDGIADAKLRYNDFYGGYVVATVCGQGYLCLIDYETKECLYGYDDSTEKNPHAVELLPDGNMVVASSVGNSVTIYAATQGDDRGYFARYALLSAHGVLWDSNLNVLWALGKEQLLAYEVGGTLEKPELILKRAYNVPAKPIEEGHDLYPVYGDGNKLWITVSKEVYQFDKTTGIFSKDFTVYHRVRGQSNKSIGNQPFSNTVVTAYPMAGIGWRTDTIHLFRPDGKGEYTLESHSQIGTGYYKARVWYPEYQ